ncbi:sialomucin core protein 24-like [Stylophora pistillata]|nr:sialomucin core protein 24-like [Stylophora pistillata]
MALMCVLRQTEMHFLGYLVIAVFLIHSSVVSGQSNTTLTSVVKAYTITSTPVGTTGSISPTKSRPSPSSSSTVPTQATLTTSVAAKTSEPATKESSRKFDGASFVGGIILGAFLTVIFILVYKWWQGRSKSYHSL